MAKREKRGRKATDTPSWMKSLGFASSSCVAHTSILFFLRRDFVAKYILKKEFEGGILLFPLSRAAIGGPFSVLCVSESHLSPQCIKIYSFFFSLNTANVELFVSSGLAYLLVQISRDVNRSRTGVNNNWANQIQSSSFWKIWVYFLSPRFLLLSVEKIGGRRAQVPLDIMTPLNESLGATENFWKHWSS